jgi:hypothetical protein
VAILLAALPVQAEFASILPDSELIEGADAIVIGTVRELAGAFVPDGDIVTNIDLELERVLLGPEELQAGGTLRIVEPGGIVGTQAMLVEPSPSYWKNNRALLFLERAEDGSWRTYGASLGKFDFVRDAAGRLLAVRWAFEHDLGSPWNDHERPAESRWRDAEAFIRVIAQMMARTPMARPEERFAADVDGTEGYFVERTAEPLQAPEAWDPATNAVFPPSAYTNGTFRWKVFDDGGFVTYRPSGSQPGYDSTGAGQRALAAWTNDPASNVDIRLGSATSAGFVNDDINAIVFNHPTAVPAGAIAYAKWYAGATHNYKGEQFFSISEGDVVVKSNLSVSQKLFDEAVTHEVGHTLGFRHSDQGTPSSTQAVMKAVLSGNYGASLGPWDQEAVRTVYELIGGTVTPGTPSSLVATAVTTTRVDLSWTAAQGAAGYTIERSHGGGAFTAIGTTALTSYTDLTVQAGETYVYRVRATNGETYSNRDHATTINFTDDPLVARQTVIRAIHLTQLRTAVNAVREAAGLAPATFTDPSPAGVAVKAVHINQLRSALAPALSALGKSVSWTDPTLGPGMTVRAVHFQQIRNYTK